jgi:putative SOS response-associated peptidase YedK
VQATWGIASPWVKGPPGAGRLVNARAETARTKPAFREAFARRRCAVPADGFYEWTGPKGARRPIRFAPAGGGLICLAGLYEVARDPATGEDAATFVVLTTEPNAEVAPVHDRMPVIVAGDDLDAWLDVSDGGGAAQAERAEALLRPAPPGLLEARPASLRVNSVANDDPSLLRPEQDPEPPARRPARRAARAQATLPLFSDEPADEPAGTQGTRSLFGRTPRG